MELLLVRHGQSKQNTGDNSKDRIPDHAIELTDVGKNQADEAGKFLATYLENVRPEQIGMWVSPYKRTRQTATCIKQHISVCFTKEDSMLTELQFGIFDAVPKDQLAWMFPEQYLEYQRVRAFNGKYFARRPGGESPFDCEIRQKLWLDSLYRDINSGNCPQFIIVVGHGGALTILRKAIFHYSHEWYEKEPNCQNCSIQRVILKDKKNEDFGYLYKGPEKD